MSEQALPLYELDGYRAWSMNGWWTNGHLIIKGTPEMGKLVPLVEDPKHDPAEYVRHNARLKGLAHLATEWAAGDGPLEAKSPVTLRAASGRSRAVQLQYLALIMREHPRSQAWLPLGEHDPITFTHRGKIVAMLMPARFELHGEGFLPWPPATRPLNDNELRLWDFQKDDAKFQAALERMEHMRDEAQGAADHHEELAEEAQDEADKWSRRIQKAKEVREGRLAAARHEQGRAA